MTLIYHQSTDPVFIKKIFLKLWRLRDEVESVIEQKTANGEAVDPKQIADEYSYKQKGAQLELLQGGGEEAASETEAPALEAAPEAEESGEDKKEEATFIVQRGSQNIPSEKQYRGMTVLGELGMDHMYFFCNHKFVEGQSIVIEFQVPNRFVINAEIAYCRAFNIRSRIISSVKLPYRVAVKFSFLKPGERTLLRDFIASVEPKVDAHQKSAKDLKPIAEESGGGGGDGFDELDGLDL